MKSILNRFFKVRFSWICMMYQRLRFEKYGVKCYNCTLPAFRIHWFWFKKKLGAEYRDNEQSPAFESSSILPFKKWLSIFKILIFSLQNQPSKKSVRVIWLPWIFRKIYFFNVYAHCPHFFYLPIRKRMGYIRVTHKPRGQNFGYFWPPSWPLLLKKVHVINWSFG